MDHGPPAVLQEMLEPRMIFDSSLKDTQRHMFMPIASCAGKQAYRIHHTLHAVQRGAVRKKCMSSYTWSGTFHIPTLRLLTKRTRPQFLFYNQSRAQFIFINHEHNCSLPRLTLLHAPCGCLVQTLQEHFRGSLPSHRTTSGSHSQIPARPSASTWAYPTGWQPSVE
ncbi:hypothetical protein DUNSADRAFT_10421 [Dunaliella salina]|uniref:Encoded protein n=1 Tax=Dunaliella salina TaxID=3046 RepID=A0ABQ7GFB6_DUNSA|nr:hypothetical protein DUNSADRAFT_10421 [Dunaliella salina]|eukprot:KAF5833300.1 hypothetical protein DUNSADRAFT_10421 [Dunaliella salina]